MKTRRVAVAMLLALSACSSSEESAVRPQRSSTVSELSPTVKAQYHTYYQGQLNQLGPWISLVNTGTAAVSLSRVTVRYWFTADGEQSLQYACDYTPRGCSNVTGTFVRLAAPADGADSYLEVGFTDGAGSLSAGEATGELYQRVAKSDWTAFDQANDHSYDASHGELADNDRITVYVDGQLVWGTPPSGTEVVDPDPGEVATVTDEEYAAFIRGGNDFGFDLFRKLTADRETNLVYSPASISYALGMAYVGARGTTATEMAQVLHSQLSPDQAATAYGRLGGELATRDVAPFTAEYGNIKELRLRLADALWVQTGFPMQPAYLTALQDRFGAPAHLLDFAAAPEPSRLAINDWVAQATADRIKDLLAQGTITEQTRLVLTNAVYFKGSWARVFVPQATRSATFFPLSGAATTCTMMGAERQSLVYAQGDGWRLVQIPYVGGKLQMTIVLPDAGRFAEIRNGLSSAWIEQATALASRRDVVLNIPKFRLEPPGIELATALRSLGLQVAFDSARADFTGMSPNPLAVSAVFHKAYISVDEAGTEAAAATALIMAGSPPEPPINFTANRPFVFLIRDASGAVLFAGQVLQP